MKTKNIRITFSQADLEDLLDGSTFDWTFDGVNVHLVRADYTCDTCGEEIELGAEHEGEDGEVYCINCEPV
jgi:hypothetical protein